MTAVPLVYLPGSMCDGRVFTDQLRDVDHGRTSPQVADLTLDDSFVGMAQRVLDEAPPRFAVVGLSMGCIVAAEMAYQAPERVVGMALMDFNLDAPDDKQNKTRQRWASEVRAGNFADVVAEIAPSMSTYPDKHGQLIADMAEVVGATGFLRQNDALLDRHDRRLIVTNFNGPILIACGRYDPLCPPRLHADIAADAALGNPEATLVIAENAGHLSTIDEPAQLTTAIQSWLQKVQQLSNERET